MILHTEILSKIQRVTWLGSALIVLGLLALLSPLIAGKTTVVLIDFILLAAGIVQLTEDFGAVDRDNRVLTLVLGAITTLAALCVLAHPLLGLRFLTFLFVGYLVGDGLWKIISALRSMTASGWLWVLARGILSLLLGVMIWQQWPVAGDSAVGIIIGVNLLSTGVALLALAGSMKDTLRNAIFALQRKV